MYVGVYGTQEEDMEGYTLPPGGVFVGLSSAVRAGECQHRILGITGDSRAELEGVSQEIIT